MKPIAMRSAALGMLLSGCGSQTVADWTFAQDYDGMETVYDIREVARGRRYVLTCPSDDMGLTICGDLAREQCRGAYRVLSMEPVQDAGTAAYALDIACGDGEAQGGRRSRRSVGR